MSVTVNVTGVTPRGYGPGGSWRSVIVSPVSGSNEPLSTEASASQFGPAETVTSWHRATGGRFSINLNSIPPPRGPPFGAEPYSAASGPTTRADDGLAPFAPLKSYNLAKVPLVSNRNSVPSPLAPLSRVEPYNAPSGPTSSGADGSAPFVPLKSCSLVKVPFVSNRNSVP